MIEMTQQLLANYSLKTELAIPASDLDFTWAKELTYQIYVKQLNGAPTAATLTAKWQIFIPATGTFAQYTAGVWIDIEAAQLNKLLVEGADYPSPLATEATTFPIAFQRTITHFGYAARVVLTPTFTGGTTPSFSISALLVAKGG